MSHMMPSEFLEQAAQFVDPCVMIDIRFPGVAITASMRRLASDEGKLLMPLNDVAAHLRFAPGLEWFELDGVGERVHIPGGAIMAVLDRATGATFTTNPDLLKAPH